MKDSSTTNIPIINVKPSNTFIFKKNVLLDSETLKAKTSEYEKKLGTNVIIVDPSQEVLAIVKNEK